VSHAFSSLLLHSAVFKALQHPQLQGAATEHKTLKKI